MPRAKKVTHLTQNDEHFQGDHGPDIIYGTDLGDVLAGGPGSDRIYGGDGDDILYADNILPGIGTYHVPTDPTPANVPALDILDGGEGDDILIGGPNNNLMTGGEDDDTFWIGIYGFGSNKNTITDFTSIYYAEEDDHLGMHEGAAHGDHLILNGDELAADFNADFTNYDPNYNFISGYSIQAWKPDQFLIYDRTTGDLSFDPDASGPLPAQVIVHLVGNPDLTAFDLGVWFSNPH